MAFAVTLPDSLEVIIGEQLDLVVDFTNLIAPGDVLSSPAMTIESTSGEFVPSAIIGVPFITNGVKMNVTISSLYLRRATPYIGTFNGVATGGAGDKNVSALLVIKVIY